MWITGDFPANRSMDHPDQNPAPQSTSQRNDSEGFRTVPQASESFGKVPNPSETFGNARNDSESFRSLPHYSERKENHTLTVRESARLFEAAGVARTERSIVNWCQPNALGQARLDAYFDPNERKYYITPASLDRAIQEEIAKSARTSAAPESGRTVPKGSEKTPRSEAATDDPERVSDLETEVMDLKILNSGKDFLIGQLRQERDGFFNKLLDASHKLGELEAKLLQLEAPPHQQG